MKKIKKIISTALITVFALSAAGCNMVAKTPEAVAKSVVAKVNNDKITRGDIDTDPSMIRFIAQLKAQYGDSYDKNDEAVAALKTQKEQLLEQLITTKLLTQKANELKLMPDETKLNSEIDQKYNEIKAAYTKEDEFNTALKNAGFDEKSLKGYLKIQIISQAVYDEVTKDIKVSDADAKKEYDTNQMKYTEKPDKMHIEHILVKTEDEAKKVISRLNKGESFAKVAKEVSTDTGSKDKGGDLGFVNYVDSGMDETFMKAAMVLKVNQISAPVKTQFGYHVIKVTEKNEYPVKKFDAVKGQIKSDLLGTKKNNAYSSKLSEWEKAAKITKYEKNLM